MTGILEAARQPRSQFLEDQVANVIFDSGVAIALAESITDVMRNCFESERFSGHFARTPLKTNLVRGGLSAAQAEEFLDGILPCVVTLLTPEVRLPILHSPAPGRVVMCDFRHLKVPEMQKERRAIVISSRRQNDPGRCTVVPVSMSPPRKDELCYVEFQPGAYPFFHKTNPVWAVCDHVYTVSLSRLWKINVNRVPKVPEIGANELALVRQMVATNLSL